LGNEDKVSEFEAGGEDLLAEDGEVVLVIVGDFLDEAMQAQAFEKARDLAAVFAG
jgi:hypothetical protein